MRLFADDSSLFTRVNGTIETHDKFVNMPMGLSVENDFQPRHNQTSNRGYIFL